MLRKPALIRAYLQFLMILERARKIAVAALPPAAEGQCAVRGSQVARKAKFQLTHYRGSAVQAAYLSAPGRPSLEERDMRIFSIWALELLKLVGRRRLHPLNVECPICHQMVRLHYNSGSPASVGARSRPLRGRSLRRAL